jgi:hypothetical protein
MTLLAAVSWGATPAAAMAPRVLHTEGYESPVHAEPDEILVICGSGFTASDHVVYEAVGSGHTTERHPAAIPATSGPLSGVAPIVTVGEPAYSLSARLPEVIQAQRIYRLWVVSAAGEWSEPITVNDPRPLWVTPSIVSETADPARLGRQVRVVGRNLRPEPGQRVQIRLEGSSTFVLTSNSAGDDSPHLGEYVVDAALPARLPVDSYTVSVSRDGRSWVEVKSQKLVVKADPTPAASFPIDDPRFGNCRPGDGITDNACFAKAIAAAQAKDGGRVVVPPGVWDLSATAGFVLPPHVDLQGSTGRAGKIVRHDTRAAQPRALFTVTGDNSITDVTFADADTFASPAESRPIIQLGEASASADAVADIIISNNDFQRVGRAIEDSGRPIVRLMVTHNRLAAYDRDLQLPGNHFGIAVPFRIDDSIVRWNTFIPGSFIDVTDHQGVIASELGASHRLDFSNNIADGAATDGLQNPDDPKGWRAAFFWNLNGNQEELLVSGNHISCSGDKAGDGEALSFDGNGDTFGFIGAQPVTRAGSVTITVHGTLLGEQGKHQPIDRGSFYRGHWVHVMEGPGAGQVRKIQSYIEDAATGSVTFTVAPAWDVLPGPGSRVVVGRNFWQLYAVANDIDQRKPPCQKANLNDPAGGVIAFWTPTADSVMAGNRQYDTSGLLFNAGYTVPSTAPKCRDCGNGAAFQVGLEIRDNLIDGEYDWDSACSESGISAALSVAPAPESPPPLVGIGISIAHNRIIGADGLYGGAIDLTATWYLGPPPGHWQLLQSVVIQHNSLENIDGPAPRACRYTQRSRAGVRLDGVDNIRNTVLYGNRCQRVPTPLIDGGKDTVRLCTSASEGSCECPASTH